MERCRPSSDTQGNAHGITLGYTLVSLDLSHCSRCTQMLMSIGHNLSCQIAGGRLEMLGKCTFEKALLETQLVLLCSWEYLLYTCCRIPSLHLAWTQHSSCKSSVSCIFNICTNCPSSSSKVHVSLLLTSCKPATWGNLAFIIACPKLKS